MPVDRSRPDVSREFGTAFGEDDMPPPSFSSSMPSGGIAFAPNVTPGTFNDPHPPLLDAPPCQPGESLLFPVDVPDASSSSRKGTHGRKKPDDYIPRPPNAFILFRSAFIRSRNVSTEVETNHSTLSKIIGLTWQNLPEKERQVWHHKAKQAEIEHRMKFPQYAFKPLHSRKGKAKRKVREVGPRDQVRCAKIADFLVQGLKGKELDAAIKEFDKTHVPEIVTRFEAPITEETFTHSAPAPAPKSKRSVSSSKARSVSSGPSRQSTPSLAFSSPSPAPSVYSSVSSYDLEAFSLQTMDDMELEKIKPEPAFDFQSFSFDSSPPSLSVSSFENREQTSPLTRTYLHEPSPSQPASSPLSRLQIESSFVPSEQWSPCASPCSPSTNSMPPTPAHGKTSLPDESLVSFSNFELLSGQALQHKSVSWGNMGPPQYETYDFSCAGQYTDPNNSYATTMSLDDCQQDMPPTDLNYASFMVPFSTYGF